MEASHSRLLSELWPEVTLEPGTSHLYLTWTSLCLRSLLDPQYCSVLCYGANQGL